MKMPAPHLFNRIWVKLSALIAGLVFLLMLLVFHLITLRQIKAERVQLREFMERTAMQIASIRLTAGDDIIVYQEWIKRILDTDAGKDVVYIAIFDRERRLLAYALNPQYLEIGDAALLTPEDEIDIIQRLSRGEVAAESWRDFDHVPVEIRTGRYSLGRVDVGFSLIGYNNRARRNLLINAYILAGAFAGVVLLSIVVGRRITQPLERLSDAMIQVSLGNLGVHVRVNTRDELGRLADSYNYMTRRLREKSYVDAFSQDLMLSLEHHRLLQLVTERIVGYMGAEGGDGVTAWSQWAAPRGLERPVAEPLDEACASECLARRDPFFVRDLRCCDAFERLQARLQSAAGLRKIELLAPLISSEETLGFFLLGPENDGSGYDGDEIRFLRTLSSQAALAVRNSFLLRRLAEQERLQKELEIARQVQQSLLPVEEPRLDGLQVFGLCLPAQKVGGDYYDYFVIDEKRLGVAVADVSGKGTSAAFYMAEIKGMMSAMTHLIHSPKELLLRLNRLLNRNVDKRVFATMIYGVVDVDARTFTYVRAGHNPPLLQRERSCARRHRAGHGGGRSFRGPYGRRTAVAAVRRPPTSLY